MSEPTQPTCRWSSARSRWEAEIRPGVSKESCGHNGHAPAIAERALTPAPEPADQTRADVVLTEAEQRIAAGRIAHGVGNSDDFAGNACHLVSPLVGWMRLCELDGKPFDDLAHTIDRLNLVLDMANEEAASSAARDAKHAAEVEALREALRVGTELDNHHNADACPYCTGPVIRRAEAAEATVARVRALADEWAEEGDDLIRNCYSGQDVFEGEQMKRCATDLRAALDGER